MRALETANPIRVTPNVVFLWGPRLIVTIWRVQVRFMTSFVKPQESQVQQTIPLAQRSHQQYDRKDHRGKMGGDGRTVLKILRDAD